MKFPGNPHEATSPSNSPAEPPSDLQALGAIIGSGVGITPASPPESQDAQPIPGPGPTKNYSISIAPFASAVVINGVTSFLSASWPKGPVAAGTMAIAVGSQQISQNAASQYVVAGQTITPGAPPITVSGTPISLNSAATQVVIGSNTLDLTPATAPPLLSFDSQIFTANSASDYIIDGQTLVPGAPALTISNTPISLAPDGSKVVIGGSTETLRPGPTLPPLIIGSQTFTANEAGAYIIGSQTLTPGASGIVVPGSLLAPGASASVFTVAGQVFTANPTAFSIDGTTISAGGPGVTISGIPVALQASGLLDVGKSTITLASAKHSDGLGALPTFTGEGDQLSLRLLYSVLASVLSLLIATMV